VSNLLPHEETTLRVFNAFSTHCRQVIDEFWDESEFVQIRLEPTIETWSPPTQLLRRLWRHLPFGRHLGPEDYKDVINSLHLIIVKKTPGNNFSIGTLQDPSPQTFKESQSTRSPYSSTQTAFGFSILPPFNSTSRIKSNNEEDFVTLSVFTSITNELN
jgi:hypothetical protein